MDPLLMVLTLSAASAAMGVLGPLPLLFQGGRLSGPALGWANALAAGLMLGPAYLLVAAGRELRPLEGAAGAVLGIGFVWWSHRADGSSADGTVAGDRIVVRHVLHSASEGVAIGTAMALDVRLGTSLAIAMAVHNVPEATVLAETLRGRGASWSAVTLLGGVTNLPQIALAVATFALATRVAALTPWVTGFAVGSLIQLVLSELLPECYQRAGRTAMALVTITAMGVVVLLAGGLR